MTPHLKVFSMGLGKHVVGLDEASTDGTDSNAWLGKWSQPRN
jgi:hypothetical protein